MALGDFIEMSSGLRDDDPDDYLFATLALNVLLLLDPFLRQHELEPSVLMEVKTLGIVALVPTESGVRRFKTKGFFCRFGDDFV